ncbi:MAG TPA: glycosyltransferase family 2 protein [Candidatus Omnitrophota bacterium]|jgi:glycosyltransferase involved in cell wall biosynthesis|nr:glycosyltransferase family 2 protein [Candidatus Omnitrophota bacterium]
MSAYDIEVSVVIPCLNESGSVGTCVEKARAYFSARGMAGEVIVVDNGSSDDSVVKALNAGAHVVHEKVRGYGASCLRGFREARGKYLVMGDADNTYDFASLDPFLDPLRRGADVVMGSRFRGKIHRGAMPWTNRYLGNPVLTGLYRLFFRTRLTDIHCGIRSLTKDAFLKLNLHCLGMEFASEMVLEALQKKLKIVETPVDYFPREGRSKLEPMKDAWRHLRFMLLFCPDWLYFVPGLCVGGSGFLVLLALIGGPVHFLGHAWDIHMLVFAAFLSILGYQILNVGLYAKLFAVKQGYLESDSTLNWFARHLRLETGVVLGLILFGAGLVLNLWIFAEWWQNAFGPLYRIRESVAGMTFMTLGLQTVFSSFFLSLMNLRR